MESVTNTLGFKPTLPTLDGLAPEDIVVRYYPESDELYVHFYGRALPAVSVDVNEYLYLRVSRETRQVVGLQFEAFLSHAVRTEPRWLWLGELAGIPSSQLDVIRREIGPARQWQSLLGPMFEELELAIA